MILKNLDITKVKIQFIIVLKSLILSQIEISESSDEWTEQDEDLGAVDYFKLGFGELETLDQTFKVIEYAKNRQLERPEMVDILDKALELYDLLPREQLDTFDHDITEALNEQLIASVSEQESLLVLALIEKGADVNYISTVETVDPSDEEKIETALSVAVYDQNPEMIQLLIIEGANIIRGRALAEAIDAVLDTEDEEYDTAIQVLGHVVKMATKQGYPEIDLMWDKFIQDEEEKIIKDLMKRISIPEKVSKWLITITEENETLRTKKPIEKPKMNINSLMRKIKSVKRN